jgi:hypothetical protein
MTSMAREGELRVLGDLGVLRCGEKTMSARAATPRRGYRCERGLAVACRDKCVGWSKDARAVRPFYVAFQAFLQF